MGLAGERRTAKYLYIHVAGNTIDVYDSETYEHLTHRGRGRCRHEGLGLPAGDLTFRQEPLLRAVSAEEAVIEDPSMLDRTPTSEARSWHT